MPDYLICLLRNLYAGQEATVRTLHGTTDCFKIGKGGRQVCILPPCLLNSQAEYSMRNTGLDESQAGIKIARILKEDSQLQFIKAMSTIAENVYDASGEGD